MRTNPLRRFGREPNMVPTDPHLLFTVHGVTYAMPLLSVREVMDLTRLTPVADAPETMRGTQVLRGHRIPVVDLGAVLEERRLRPTRTSCTLLVQNLLVHDALGQNDDALVGFAVDGVIGVKGLDASARLPAPRLSHAGAGGTDVVAMASTEQGLVPLLDPARLLASADVRRALEAWHAAEAGIAQPAV
jgi:chemotaxis signal transduction protein